MLSIIYCKSNLRIDSKKRLTCFYELYGYYLEFSPARRDLHEPVDYSTKRANQMEVFGYKKKNNLYRTKGTFIV